MNKFSIFEWPEIKGSLQFKLVYDYKLYSKIGGYSMFSLSNSCFHFLSRRLSFIRTVTLMLLFSVSVLNAAAQQKKPRIKANVINEHIQGHGDFVKFDSLKTTKGKGITGCVNGLSYTYKVKSNNYVQSGETMLPYLDDGLAIIIFTNTSDFNLYFRVTIKGVYDEGINVQCLGKYTNNNALKQGGSSNLGEFPVILSASESSKVIKIDNISKNKYIEKDGMLTTTVDEKLSCDYSFTIKLPPALKPLEAVEADSVVVKKENKEDDFWSGSNKKDETATVTDQKKETKTKDDFWSGSGKGTTNNNKTTSGKDKDDFWSGSGKGSEDKNTNNDFWEGATNEDLVVKYKAKNSGDKWGYANEKGEIIINCIYNYTYDFKENFGRVKTAEGYGFVNKNGKIITKGAFMEARDFSNGMAAVKQNGKWGFINKTGQVVIPCTYDEVEDFKGDIAIASMIDNKIEKSGECNQYFTLYLKTSCKLNKTNSVLSKEKVSTINHSGFSGFHLTTTRYEEWKATKTKAELDAIEAERAAECAKTNKAIKENLKSQAESAGYKLQEKK